MYQGRVVLVALAAELALKWLWEQENKVPAKNVHALFDWFNWLSPQLKQAVRDEYRNQVGAPKEGWETVDKVFETCDMAIEQWRYIFEKNSFPNYVIQATYLKHATLSVLKVGEAFAEKE